MMQLLLTAAEQAPAEHNEADSAVMISTTRVSSAPEQPILARHRPHDEDGLVCSKGQSSKRHAANHEDALAISVRTQRCATSSPTGTTATKYASIVGPVGRTPL